MAYDTLEESVQGGQPVELYTFRRNSYILGKYTSSDAPVTVDGEYFAVWDGGISRSSLGSTVDEARNSLHLEVARDFPIAQLFNLTPPTDVVSVVVQRYHRGDTTDLIVIWIGRVMACQIDSDEKRTLVCEPVSTSQARTGLRRLCQKNCHHALYGPSCRLDKGDYETITTITAVNGRTIDVAGLRGYSYAGGFVQKWADDGVNLERRFIVGAGEAVGAAEADPFYDNVVLLLNMDGANGSTVFNDTSSYAATVNVVGNTHIDTSDYKFNGASGYFDGTSDILYLSDGTRFDFGSGDFTIEAWVKSALETPSANQMICGCASSGNYGRFWLRAENAAVKFYASSNNSSADIINGLSCGNIAGRTWAHIAVTRQGDTWRTFNNGVLISTTVQAGTFYSGFATPVVGGKANYLESWYGWLDEVRWTKGVCRYTNNFAVQTASWPTQSSAGGDTYYPQVVLLLHGDGGNGTQVVTDDSQYQRTPGTTSYGFTISAEQSVTNGTSMKFIGAAPVVSWTESTDFDLSTNNFTLETFFMVTTLAGISGNGHTLFSRRSQDANGWAFVTSNTGGMTLRAKIGGSWSDGWCYTAGGLITPYTWHHAALVRNGSSLLLFIDGTLRGSDTLTSGAAFHDETGQGFRLAGADVYGENPLTGWLDEVRITVGAARYTTNFTPDTAGWPNSQTAEGNTGIGAGASLTLSHAFISSYVGETVYVYPGCDHTLQTCNDVFGNVKNYGGRPFVPRKNPFGVNPIYGETVEVQSIGIIG